MITSELLLHKLPMDEPLRGRLIEVYGQLDEHDKLEIESELWIQYYNLVELVQQSLLSMGIASGVEVGEKMPAGASDVLLKRAKAYVDASLTDGKDTDETVRVDFPKAQIDVSHLHSLKSLAV